ncbi:MAG: putative transposase [Verrucomicrobiales bacterium]|jgi:putative transposase
MPRAPRIEYENAIYHVMARGNHRQDIVFDDSDRKLFLHTLGEVAQRTGWRIYAWVLMNNHYHIALQTPQPNLVVGMSWLQNTFTRRMNTKNGLWGHLFGGRYKAVLVEAESDLMAASSCRGDYLMTLIDYIHLNPARAGLLRTTLKANGVRIDGSVLDFPWSSLASAYAVAPSKQEKWMAVDEGMELFGYRNTTAGRRRFVERVQDRARGEVAERIGAPELEGQSLQSTLRRGWYWGSQTFREALIDRFPVAGNRQTAKRNRNARSSQQIWDHGLRAAEQLLAGGMTALGLRQEQIERPVRGDLRRLAIAWMIWTQTAGVSQGWIAERLNLKSAANASQQIRRFAALKNRERPKEIRRWISAQLEKFD